MVAIKTALTRILCSVKQKVHFSSGDKSYVRRFGHSPLCSDFGRDQNREPFFLCLPMQKPR